MMRWITYLTEPAGSFALIVDTKNNIATDAMTIYGMNARP